MRKGLRLLILGVSVLAAIAMSSETAMASHWGSATSYFSPAVVYQGVLTPFTFELHNGASSTLYVYYVWARFCWNPPAFGYEFKADDGTWVTIPGYGSHDFVANILVDQTWSGNCVVVVRTDGWASPDPGRIDLYYNFAITVLIPQPLQVTIAANPNTGTAPLSVSFTSTVTGGIEPYTYAWTFGDGGTSSLANPSHTYTSPGTYTPQLVVTDSQAEQDSAQTTVTVTPASAALVANAAADRTSGPAPLAVQFSGSASGGTAPYTYAWTFGDGGTSVQQNPTHTYQNAGSYTAQLTVTDAASRTAMDSETITVTGGGPGTLSASAAADKTSGQHPLTVAFTGSASGGTPPYTYAWTFGDGGTSPDQNPTHQYANAGNFLATLTVTDATSQTDTATVGITVTAPTPPDGGSAAGGIPPWVFLAIAGVAVAVGIGAFLAKRRRAAPQVGQAPPPAPTGSQAPPTGYQAPPTASQAPPTAYQTTPGPYQASSPPVAEMPTAMEAPVAPRVVACPNCRSTWNAGTTFCGKCGTRLA